MLKRRQPSDSSDVNEAERAAKRLQKDEQSVTPDMGLFCYSTNLRVRFYLNITT